MNGPEVLLTLFQPLLYQVATGGLSPANISAPLRSVLKRQKNTRVLLAEALDFNFPPAPSYGQPVSKHPPSRSESRCWRGSRSIGRGVCLWSRI